MKRASLPIAAVLAASINLLLLAVLLWSAIEGDVREMADIVVMCLALFPLLNLVALVLRASSSESTATFVKATRVLNFCLAAAAVLVGVASASELTFSGLEQVATLLLLVPPVLTAWALSTPLPISSQPDVGVP